MRPGNLSVRIYLLTLSRRARRDIVFSNCDLSGLIAEAKTLLEKQIKDSGAVIEVQEIPHITCHETSILILFQNLIANAIKYCDKDRPQILIKYEDDLKYYLFSVIDNGIGIEPEMQQKVFALFKKAHNNNKIKGSGAGLAIVETLVKQHQGRVWVAQSKVGQGTIIKFTISKELELSHAEMSA
ncbi:MAG: ATP-binding protein [Verrucomicrobiota bacterium]